MNGVSVRVESLSDHVFQNGVIPLSNLVYRPVIEVISAGLNVGKELLP